MTTTSPLILFGRNALTIKGDISSIASSDVHSIVDLTELETENAQNRYATYEPDYWLLDGNYHFIPSPPGIGYLSGTQSGSGSNFSVAPTLTIIFNTAYSTTDGLTLYFSQLTNDYADSITVAYYDASNALIRTDNYTPSSWEFSTNQAVTAFKKIIITFTSTNKNNRFARLLGLDFDSVYRFEKEQVKEARLIEEVNFVNIELPYNTLDLTLFSDDPDFSIVAPSGFFASLQYREPLEAFEIIDGQILFLGRFYLNHWESENEHRAKFQALDLIGLTDSIADIGGYINDDMIDSLDFILDRAGVEYAVDSFTAALGVGLYLPGTTTREGLQHMLFNRGRSRFIIGTCARSRVIEILSKNYSIFNPDTTLTTGEINRNAQLTLKPVITSIEVSYVGFSQQSTTETIFTDSFDTGFHTIILDNGPWDMTTYVVTGGTIATSNRMFVVISVASPGTVSMTGKRLLIPKRTYTLENPDIGANTEPFKVAVNEVRLASSSFPIFIAEVLLAYYDKRYVLETRIIAPLFGVGDKIVAPVQGGKYIAGFVERMDSDLARGFLSDIRVIGRVVDSIPFTLTAAKYNDTHAGLAYYGAWATSANGSAYSGDLHTTLTGEEASVEFAFNGSWFKVVYSQLASHGSMQIWVDDASLGAVSQNGSTAYQTEWSSPVHSVGIHYVRITNVSGSIIDIDAIEVF